MATATTRTTAWTGGQDSLYRMVLGVTLAAALAAAATPLPALVAGELCAVMFIAGALDWLAALGLLAILPLWGGVHPGGLHGLLLLLLLTLHLGAPARPYGAWAMRGRLDPGGGFALPRFVPATALVLFAAAHAGAALFTLDRGAADSYARTLAYCQLGAVACLVLPRGRPIAWVLLGVLAFVAPPPCSWLDALVLLVPLQLAAFDPAWLPPRRRPEPLLVCYDGHCGLCHRFVRFCLAEDPTGDLLRYAPLQGETFAAAVPAAARATLPDSVVVRDAKGAVKVRSTAALSVLDTLGGLWRIAAALLWFVPRPLRDLAYDGIATVRKRLFATPAEACPILPPPLRARFLP